MVRTELGIPPCSPRRSCLSPCPPPAARPLVRRYSGLPRHGGRRWLGLLPAAAASYPPSRKLGGRGPGGGCSCLGAAFLLSRALGVPRWLCSGGVLQESRSHPSPPARPSRQGGKESCSRSWLGPLFLLAGPLLSCRSVLRRPEDGRSSGPRRTSSSALRRPRLRRRAGRCRGTSTAAASTA